MKGEIYRTELCDKGIDHKEGNMMKLSVVGDSYW
jgi:hypothetical protein